MSETGAISVVGARGFIGAHLMRYFAAQDVVARAYGRGDDARLLADQHKTVFYCAGFTGDYMDDPVATIEAHAALISRIVAQARFERLVYCSSTRLYDSAGVNCADEQTPLVFSPENPRHLYDLSKALGEHTCLGDPKKRCVVARISNVFDLDPQATGFVVEWLRAAQDSQEVMLNSSPHLGRDYIHIEDVILALVAIAASPENGVFNVAAGRITTNAEIAAELAEIGIATRFSSDVIPAALPIINIRRLQALGVSPRDMRDLFTRRLKG